MKNTSAFGCMLAPSAGVAAAYNDSVRVLQAISAEFGDYSKRLMEDGTVTMSQMAHAASPPEAFGMLAAFGKRTTEEYFQQMTRIASMYSAAAGHQTAALQALMTPLRG